jgi:hypothetical protein
VYVRISIIIGVPSRYRGCRLGHAPAAWNRAASDRRWRRVGRFDEPRLQLRRCAGPTMAGRHDRRPAVGDSGRQNNGTDDMGRSVDCFTFGIVTSATPLFSSLNKQFGPSAEVVWGEAVVAAAARLKGTEQHRPGPPFT